MKMRILTAFCMCLRKYTCLPSILNQQDEDLDLISRAFLPAVGLIAGLIWWVLALLAKSFLPALLGAALVAAYPFVISACVHLKGFVNVSESLLMQHGGCKEAPKGFCVSAVLVLLAMVQFAACADAYRCFPLLLIPVLSRVCCALHLLKQAESGQEDEQLIPASLLHIEKGIALCALVLMLLFSGAAGLFSGIAVMGGYVLCKKLCDQKAAAICADHAGFALTVSELLGLIILAVL